MLAVAVEPPEPAPGGSELSPSTVSMRLTGMPVRSLTICAMTV
jgi:hypothetical protein